MSGEDDEARDRGKTQHVDLPLGRKLRLARDAGGLTQADLAVRLDVSPATVQKYEKGQVRVPAARLWQMCRLLKVDVAELFEDLPHHVVGAHLGMAKTATPFVDDSGRESRVRAITRAAAKLPDERLEMVEVMVKALKPKV